MSFNSVEEVLEDIKAGKMMIVVDDEGRENEGDLFIAAEKVTPECVNFMVTWARGLLCTPITEDRAKELDLPAMVKTNKEHMGTAFTVSIDHISCTTGISAFDRALTVNELTNINAGADVFTKPGHVFPLIAKSGGVFKRAGHTEAAVDICKLAGLYPAGMICEIMNADGTMARTPQLMDFARKHQLKIITVASLVEYRRTHENAQVICSG